MAKIHFFKKIDKKNNASVNGWKMEDFWKTHLVSKCSPSFCGKCQISGYLKGTEVVVLPINKLTLFVHGVDRASFLFLEPFDISVILLNLWFVMETVT